MRDRKAVLTTGGAAEFCGVSASTIRNWTNSRGLPCRIEMDSGNRFILRDDLIEFLKKNGIAFPKANAAEAAGGTYNILLIGVPAKMTLGLIRAIPATDSITYRMADTFFQAGYLANQNPPDLIVTDLSIGRSEAMAMATWIKSLKWHGSCQLIAIAGEDEVHVTRLFEAGFNEAFVRPFDDDAVTLAIKDRIGR